MKPPVCYICSVYLMPNEGGLVYFSEDEDDKNHNTRLEKSGYTGHPSNAFWFCSEHYSEARKLSFLQKTEALKILHQKFTS